MRSEMSYPRSLTVEDACFLGFKFAFRDRPLIQSGLEIAKLAAGGGRVRRIGDNDATAQAAANQQAASAKGEKTEDVFHGVLGSCL